MQGMLGGSASQPINILVYPAANVCTTGRTFEIHRNSYHMCDVLLLLIYFCGNRIVLYVPCYVFLA